ncbi:MAG: hypothetical protein ABFE07_16955 [Armatimonadia bacterium]
MMDKPDLASKRIPGCPGAIQDRWSGAIICLGDGRPCEREDCHRPEWWAESRRIEELFGDCEREEA